MINEFYLYLYNSFVCTQFKSQSSFWPIDKTLSGNTTLGQSEPGINGNEEVLNISPNSMGGASSSDCLVSYIRISLVVGSYTSAEM